MLTGLYDCKACNKPISYNEFITGKLCKKCKNVLHEYKINFP